MSLVTRRSDEPVDGSDDIEISDSDPEISICFLDCVKYAVRNLKNYCLQWASKLKESWRWCLIDSS